MNLHKDPSAFYDTLLAVADHWGTSPAIVEKDYFVTMLLESLARRIPNMIQRRDLLVEMLQDH